MMVPAKTSLYGADSQLRREFQLYEQDIRIQNYRMCSGLASFFMVAGASLDLIVYKLAGLWQFLPFRIMSAVMLLIISFLLGTKWGRDWHRTLGICMSVPLMGSIGWMIYAKEGYASPYYAGLNLVMLGAAILMRWPLFESVLIVFLTIDIYFAACFFHGPVSDLSLFFNNCYFLFVTGVFTVAGTWFYNNIRFSEFLLRQSLDTKHIQLQDANLQLEKSNQKLRELDEAKSRFFANISHELRTPLTLLIAPVETLLNKGEGILPAERQAMLGTMQANAMRLLKLINTLLDLVRLETHTVELQKAPVILADFIHGLGKACLALAQDKRITIETACASDIQPIMADVEKLERVCLNLLFNALKFTPAGGRISLTAVRENDHLCIQVRDTGVGIAEEHLTHLFTRFWQADASSQRRFQGMGIGLALVKEIVELHGGSVSVESKVGKGSTFSARLPYEPAHDAATVPKVRLKADGEPITGEWIIDLYRRAEFSTSLADSPRRSATEISPPKMVRKDVKKAPTLLIAEDEPDMMTYLCSQLSEDFEIIQATDGSDAVTKASQYLPDIVLSDLMMPYKDGMQVCRELRERTSTRMIPVVLLTARPDERTKIEALTAGATDFIGKPFSLTEVRVRLMNLAASNRYQRELADQKKRLEATLEQLKEAESILVQHEKLSSLGRMSAGLIHEINNPLNFASQGIYWLKQLSGRLPDTLKGEFAETLDDIDTGVKRVVTIITDLRSFTRPNQEGYSDFELQPLVETVLRFFSHHKKDGVSFVVDVPEGLMIHGNHGHITQVLVNLLQNGIDATADKTYPAGEEPTIQIHVSQKQDRVILSVKDNGSGMSRETQDNVFDPFFTTKEVGKGLGLGLSICHRILADHQGLISIHSEQGIGTEFILDLPEASFYRTHSQENTLL
ncbi:MAG: ATP-binding protein [Verrucomicrobia bacterium]|nr:ATP-binding protein [Verrucomicrobiota bacterium]